ncbi:Adenylate kinase [Tritrichomonas foetus]|uniref:Adenylate kinase n=1 Tax=Tritrichomonas foetus TaxID=1144522 RepID=A0A1J4JY21_9EUKA|nr:Adenylate kinase [Tritrichomonas foetus]|eukprot:OHT03352.1 Adenylate kinase [Tritrichomonas foetus]
MKEIDIIQFPKIFSLNIECLYQILKKRNNYFSKMSHPFRLIFFGPPGGGKGTQSAKLKEEFGVHHISTGDALRAEIRAGTELGNRVKGIVESGSLVDDDTIMDVLKSAIQKASDTGFILDGIPRTIGQVHKLDNMLKEIGKPVTHVIYITVNHDELKKRIVGRLFHPGSGRTYHKEFNPPKVDMKDDLTGEDLIIRKDDTEEVFEARMKAYNDTFQPVIEYYEKHNLLKTVEGAGKSVDQIYEEVKAILNK